VSYDDVGEVARLKTNPHAGPPGRGRSEPPSGGDTGKQQIIQVATRCATLDEFVERFATFAWEGSLVLPAASALPVGTQGRFIILLKDQSIAMKGRCRVTEAKPTPVSSRNPTVKRVMMRVALLEMDEASRAVHKRLIALRSAPVPLPVPPEPSETTQIEPARGGTAPGAAAAPPPVAEPPVAAVPPVAPAPVAPAPAAPVRPPPLASRVQLNRTMIGVGIAPITKSSSPVVPAAPPVVPAPPVAAVPVAPPPVAHVPLPAPMPLPGVPPALAPPQPRVETRAPGAPDQLPANPLAQFDADDVESFIECTLLESSGEVPVNVAGTAPEESMAVATTLYERPATLKATAWLQGYAKKLPPRFQGPAVRAAPYAPYAVIAIISIVAGVVIGHGGKRAPALPPVIAQAAAPAPAPAPPPEPAIAAPEAKPAAPTPAPAAPAASKPAPAPAAPKPAVAAPEPVAEKTPAVAEKAALPAVAAKPAAPAPAEKPAAKAPAPAEKLAVAEKPAQAEKAAERAAAPPTGDCVARVVTEPKDAKVIWAGAVIGRSPLDGARVPCGPATVTIERERWQPATVDVNAQAGAVAKVHERLRRPRTKLAVSSTPPGAQITVNRVAAGAAPKAVDVSRFEAVQIRATLKGYQPWNKTVYLKEADAKLDIQLVARK